MTPGRKSPPPRRGRPPAEDKERKDRLIQTRVEEDLDEALRAEAKRRRVTVSQLIRNVLHDTFQFVDDLVVNTTNLTEAVKRDALRIAASAQGMARNAPPMAPPPAPPPVLEAEVEAPAPIAWQEVVLSAARACGNCGTPLAKGAPAFMGVMEDPAAPRPFWCPACVQALRAS